VDLTPGLPFLRATPDNLCVPQRSSPPAGGEVPAPSAGTQTGESAVELASRYQGTSYPPSLPLIIPSIPP
jgi:hypothetical protein